MDHDKSRPRMARSIRNPQGFHREVCILPVLDQTQGKLGTSCILLELCSHTDGFGQTRRSVNWSPPFPTKAAALDFAARLSKPAATVEFDPTSAQEGHEI